MNDASDFLVGLFAVAMLWEVVKWWFRWMLS